MEEQAVGAMVAPSIKKKQRIIPFNQRKRQAVKPGVRHFASIDEAVMKLRPAEPVHALRLKSVAMMTEWFTKHFPGDVMFAVKTNPEPLVLETAYASGMRHFDVASLNEAELIHSRFPKATMHFMHPVKSREAIHKAYYYYGIRHFSLDSHAELEKILEVTGHADDLRLSVRLSIPNDKAAMQLTGKFGVPLDRAASLLQATRKAASKFGICFHVGSQCMDPEAFTATIGYVHDLLAANDLRLDMLDVGGGFPSIYPDKIPPAMIGYMDAIKAAIRTLPIDADCQILCEPGRALVAEAGSLIARVELRKDGALYINDGVYGSLFDAGAPHFIYPSRAIRPGHSFEDSDLVPFMFYGPTCDSCDTMQGPFMLPADIAEGDWIEIGQLGAYGSVMQTKFNGFHSDALITVDDEPMLKMDME